MAANNAIATYHCVRAMLLMFNILFWCCGVIVIWLAAWMQTDLQEYFAISAEYSEAAPLVFVVVGTVIIIVSVLSCSCILRVQPTMLVVYGSFLITMLFTIITMSAYIYTYKDQLISGLNSGINNRIQNYDTPPTNHTKLIDFIQIKFKCCGSESYADWSMSPEQKIPESCCIRRIINCNTDDPTTLQQEGCSQKLSTYITLNLTLVGATTSALALFPLFGIILAFCMAATSKKTSYQLIL